MLPRPRTSTRRAQLYLKDRPSIIHRIYMFLHVRTVGSRCTRATQISSPLDWFVRSQHPNARQTPQTATTASPPHQAIGPPDTTIHPGILVKREPTTSNADCSSSGKKTIFVFVTLERYIPGYRVYISFSFLSPARSFSAFKIMCVRGCGRLDVDVSS